MNDKDREPKIHPTAQVDDSVELGDWTGVHAHAVISGNIKIGRAGWILPYSEIGGGRKELGFLRAGDFLHVGKFAFINIARKVKIGHEVGLGQQTKLYTHGAYLSSWEGFPSKEGNIVLGDNVWLPQATVMPDVKIGSNVIVLTGSDVTKDLPSCCLAGGSPARVIRENVFPTNPSLEKRTSILEGIVMLARMSYNIKESMYISKSARFLKVGKTRFSPEGRSIVGPANKDTERIRDLLRREGIRFRYYDNGGEYRKWD